MRSTAITISAAVFALLLIFAAGCTAATEEKAGSAASSPADEAYARGLAEYGAANYRVAEERFAEACALYADAGDPDKARTARNAMFRANRTYMEYSLDTAAAEAALREKVPGITDAAITDWLENRAQKIVSENETLYFYDVAGDYLYAHPGEMQKQNERSLDFDYVARYAWSGNRSEHGPYVNPVRYEGVERLEIPFEALPSTGILKIWFPLPVETDAQRNVTVTNLSCPDFISAGPVTTGPIGYVYYEIPVEAVNGNLVLSADIAFTSYEQIFEDINPEKVGEYDTSDPGYLLYTKSERNIELTDAVREKALLIVGNETNPHLQAQMIYRHIIETYPYSHVPHGSLDAREPKVAESTHMFETDHGDCGTQSMLFAALCRSLGIPARAVGGYQMLLSETPGTHFWAEYYLPGYGWVPNDVTVAEAADWVVIPEEKRSAFKDYYAANLDPARLVIQKNVDAPMDPAIPGDAVVFRVVRQYPAIVCDTAEDDLDLIGMECFGITLEPVA
ncbi:MULTISPECIES: transglutaminase-like domain-containing protein [Methanoculleus]|uniref:Transglutaminase domain protein n=2 Tax=Methanoculleus TaxID=45989 RepID=A3CUL9_METMJ|nr:MULTISPECIES: transglutaminase domain-containing protein [Methanoculleus]ABN57069.1 transglutaminase domain protein [Methanoculleus marisnigri JR1]UYU18485.1 transglutaminase domain-containing protein [Methanoculleus submarinus]